MTRRAIFLLFPAPAAVWAQAASDDRIYDEVRRRLANDPDVKGGTFRVEVKDGQVTVEGVVTKPKFKEKAEKLIRKVKGVTGVVNRIVVKPEGIL